MKNQEPSIFIQPWQYKSEENLSSRAVCTSPEIVAYETEYNERIVSARFVSRDAVYIVAKIDSFKSDSTMLSKVQSALLPSGGFQVILPRNDVARGYSHLSISAGRCMVKILL